MGHDMTSQAGVEAAPDELRSDLVHVFGHREELSLDERMRFRLPDHLAGVLAQEMGRLGAGSQLSPAARQRLAFYFVPGTQGRIFLYPAQNIHVAIRRFESPPAGLDLAGLRAARDYFYSMMEFVEADRQNRLQIPSHLCSHAKISDGDRQVVVIAHNLWLSLSSAETAVNLQAGGREAFDAIASDVLDPIRKEDDEIESGS